MPCPYSDGNVGIQSVYNMVWRPLLPILKSVRVQKVKHFATKWPQEANEYDWSIPTIDSFWHYWFDTHNAHLHTGTINKNRSTLVCFDRGKYSRKYDREFTLRKRRLKKKSVQLSQVDGQCGWIFAHEMSTTNDMPSEPDHKNTEWSTAKRTGMMCNIIIVTHACIYCINSKLCATVW